MAGDGRAGGKHVIEELRDFLIRHGVGEEIADQVHDAYCDGGEPGVEELMMGMNGGDRDYAEEMLNLTAAWKDEMGE